jgi:hypothetical protein
MTMLRTRRQSAVVRAPRFIVLASAVLIATACAHPSATERPVAFPDDSPGARLVRRLTSDLRNLQTAQEVRYSESGRYAREFAEFDGIYRTSTDVLVVLHGDGTAWAAAASTPDLPGVECRLTIGRPMTAPAWAARLEPGVPTCVELPGSDAHAGAT